MDRRQFIRSTIAGSAIAGMAFSCRNSDTVSGSIIGASSNIGHLLRDKDFSSPVSTEQCNVVIIGGGISGLSAARWLQKNNIDNVIVLDIENTMGGNAAHGMNRLSSFPWGAHYVPIPNNDLKAYLNFLEESEVITGYDTQGLPIYNEFHLCFDPEERLYINGKWQEGLVPQYGLPAADKAQVERFLQLMDKARYQKGSDGKDAFAIPVAQSSKDNGFTCLDNITMKQWLLTNSFTSEYLHWYVNYCTRDDFGTPYDVISAWAGIHYFAARKGRGSNAEHQDVLTWPEGNGFLVKQLMHQSSAKHYNNSLAVRVAQDNGKVLVTYFDVQSGSVKAIEAMQCICCVPQFVAARLLKDDNRLNIVHQHLHYVPWMVANLCVEELEERSGAPISWDNVIYGSDSLGYVEATHQLLNYDTRKNLTYYLPLTGKSPSEARKEASVFTHAQWAEIVLKDLQKVHPNIRSATKNLDVMIWGHAMAQPLPGLIHGSILKQLSASQNNNIHFAHTDLAGISIFEEAFYQGMNAANKVINSLSS